MDDAGFSMSNVGQMMNTIGNYDSAMIAHNEALRLRKETGYKKGEAYSWQRLGQLYNEKGDPVKSIEAFNKSVKLYEDLKADEELASVLEDLEEFFKNKKIIPRLLAFTKEH